MMLADTCVNWWSYTQGGLTLIVAIIAAVIAFLGWEVNRQKLRLDLYQKRYAIYENLRKTAEQFVECFDPIKASELLSDMEFARVEASFLYGEEIENDIEQIVKLASEYQVEVVAHHEQGTLKLMDVMANLLRISTGIVFGTVAVSGKLKKFLDFHNVGLQGFFEDFKRSK